jgi:hypothetical protein
MAESCQFCLPYNEDRLDRMDEAELTALLTLLAAKVEILTAYVDQRLARRPS